MGNKLGRRRYVVDEKYTKPQGLYQHKDIDQKKLRKLILDSKLAPCYPGDEECSAFDLEECPICFLYYPSLNRSRCCMKGICTECFLQMKPHHSTRPVQCPFCKTPNYAVEYRGVRTKEEKGMEQVEEQKVIEAKIRRRQQELQESKERMLKRQDISSSSRIMTSGEVEYRDVSSSSLEVPSFSFHPQQDEIIPSEDIRGTPAFRYSSRSRQNRENEFDLDLEEIMVMEAIWLSIQEHSAHRDPASSDNSPAEPFVPEHHYSSEMIVTPESSPSGGLACAIAAMAERQHISNGGSSASASGNETLYNMSPNSGGSSFEEGRVVGSYAPDNWIEVSPNSGRAVPREDVDWTMEPGSEVAEAGTSYASSDATLEVGSNLALNDGVGNHFQPAMAGSITPESFEEHMMLAMAVSLADAQGQPSSQGHTWH